MDSKARARATAKAAPDPRAEAAPVRAAHNPLVPPGASQQDHDNTPTSTAGTGAGEVARARRKIDEPKVRVKVARGFNLTLDSGVVVPYAAGEHDMPQSHAEHFYTQHHVEK